MLSQICSTYKYVRPNVYHAGSNRCGTGRNAGNGPGYAYQSVDFQIVSGRTGVRPSLEPDDAELYVRSTEQ